MVLSDTESIPEFQSPEPRTLVLCFDGTANYFEDDNTNVVKFFSLLKKDEEQRQLCYYQAGIGTYFKPGAISPFFSWAGRLLDQAVAWYLDEHIADGYRFLMQNYRNGDTICLFGFSRGAYVARCLAGMIHKVGLLLKDNHEQVPFAFKLYTRTDDNGIKLALRFKETYSRHVRVNFVGVWDTVSSVGVLRSRVLPFTENNRDIRTFRQALSLDEHRAKFQPNLFHGYSVAGTTASQIRADTGLHVPEVTETPATVRAPRDKARSPRMGHAPSDPGPGPSHRAESSLSPVWSGRRLPAVRRESLSDSELPPFIKAFDNPDVADANVTLVERPRDRDRRRKRQRKTWLTETETDVLEVWFSGAHADVGGGAVLDEVKLSLAQITLRWMVREVTAAQCGILFDWRALARHDVQVGILDSPSPTRAGLREKARDRIDAAAPVHDELSIDRVWWLAEIVPLFQRWQDQAGVWRKGWRFNLGRGRQIPDPKPNFHFTVKQRMEDTGLKYYPRAQWREGSEVYVE